MNPILRKVLVGLAVLVSLGVFVFAFTLGGDEDEPTVGAVQRVIPENGSPVAVRQAEIGVDLAVGYTAVLVIDGIEIPDDQLRRNDPEAMLFFTPGEGKAIESLSPGEHQVTAFYWRITDQTRDDAQSISWRFRAA